MKKKLDTRFPAARIKKIMQTNEEIGKIAMAVPLLISKALELFLQNLCQRTYEITYKQRARTLNSFHLKQCVNAINLFDFLKDIVAKVPDLGGSDVIGEDRSVAKKRKVCDDEDGASDDEHKRRKMNEQSHGSSSGKGRGRGRGRGNRALEWNETADSENFEDDSGSCYSKDKQDGRMKDEEENKQMKENNNNPSKFAAPVRVHDFDLNVDLNEYEDEKCTVVEAPCSSSSVQPDIGNDYALLAETHHRFWEDLEKRGIVDAQFVGSSRRIDEEEEDYDEGC